jgi:hypothetical protein
MSQMPCKHFFKRMGHWSHKIAERENHSLSLQIIKIHSSDKKM